MASLYRYADLIDVGFNRRDNLMVVWIYHANDDTNESTALVDG